MISDMYSIAVVVSDGKKALEWYRDKLGFKVVNGEGHWILVAPKDSGTAIHLCEADQTEPGNTGIRFSVDDVDATFKELSAKGVEFVHEPEEKYGTRRAVFKDPDGNEFWLFPQQA